MLKYEYTKTVSGIPQELSLFILLVCTFVLVQNFYRSLHRPKNFNRIAWEILYLTNNLQFHVHVCMSAYTH